MLLLIILSIFVVALIGIVISLVFFREDKDGYYPTDEHAMGPGRYGNSAYSEVPDYDNSKALLSAIVADDLLNYPDTPDVQISQSDAPSQDAPVEFGGGDFGGSGSSGSWDSGSDSGSSSSDSSSDSNSSDSSSSDSSSSDSN